MNGQVFHEIRTPCHLLAGAVAGLDPAAPDADAVIAAIAAQAPPVCVCVCVCVCVRACVRALSREERNGSDLTGQPGRTIVRVVRP